MTAFFSSTCGDSLETPSHHSLRHPSRCWPSGVMSCHRISRLTLLSLMPCRSASLRLDVPAVKAAMSRSVSV
jgi:hypothetical protein